MKKLTGRANKVFEAFVAAVGLSYKPNFKSGEILYSGMPYAEEELTQEQITQTPEFHGFIDGYEKRPPRFSGPAGSRQKNQSIFRDFQRMVLEAQGVLLETDPDAALSMKELSLLPAISEREERNHPLTRYNNGYQLGCSARP